MGCLVGIIGGFFKGLFTFLRWSFTNGLKGFLVLAVVAVLVLTIVLVVKNKVATQITPTTPTVTTQAIYIPASDAAPFMVSTPSRYYYAEKAVKDKNTGIVTMTNYWELDGAKWVKRPVTLTLNPNTYGKITISKR